MKKSYCKLAKRLTKEHVIPSWIIREQPDSNIRFDLTQQRVSERVPTIRDVCSGCNSGALSTLDSYALTLYDRYFSNKVPERGVVFEYDYDLLARWLLKVAFNSARKTNSRPDELESFADYILGKIPRPVNYRILCFLLRPTIVTQAMRRRLGKHYQGPNSVAPKNISITRLSKILPDGLNVLMGRAVLINSYCFVILTLPAELARQTRRRLMIELTSEFARKFYLVYVIDPRFKRMKLMMSDTDLIEMKRDSLVTFKDAYDDYYRRKYVKRIS